MSPISHIYHVTRHIICDVRLNVQPTHSQLETTPNRSPSWRTFPLTFIWSILKKFCRLLPLLYAVGEYALLNLHLKASTSAKVILEHHFSTQESRLRIAVQSRCLHNISKPQNVLALVTLASYNSLSNHRLQYYVIFRRSNASPWTRASLICNGATLMKLSMCQCLDWTSVYRLSERAHTWFWQHLLVTKEILFVTCRKSHIHTTLCTILFAMLDLTFNPRTLKCEPHLTSAKLNFSTMISQ